MSTLICDIPEHAWLVVELDDLLDELDPMGLMGERVRAHEYLPEIPDIIGLMVRGEVVEGDVNYFAILQNAVIPGVPHETLNVDGCGSLDDAIARVLAHDHRRFGELPPPEGNSKN